MEQNLRNYVNFEVNGVANNATVIQNFRCIGRRIEHNVQNGKDAIQRGYGHGQQEQDENEREQASDEAVFFWVYGFK